MDAGSPTVFIVDDDGAVRDSLALLVKSMSLRVETFESARAFLDQYDPARPGCLVLDIRMPLMSGLELQQVLAERGIAIPIIFITGHGDVSMAVHAMRAGAVDFVEKPFKDQDLLDRINQALALDRSRRTAADQLEANRARFDSLTPRELEVMRRIVQGQANKVIAVELGLSERTVEIHRAKVMSKTGAKSLAELVAIATRVDAP
ncbi:MAG: response regulator transcription factor [Gammaproteobacteria bacterium]|nr:response regulator transcription factor [Gammaproteobacteria bacterium]MBI5616299.1 response regulator transcription factor [Gammaproteobacteria bacterium]